MQKPNKILLLLLLITYTLPSSTAMADEPSSSETAVYIVYTEKLDTEVFPQDHHIKTLSSVLRSEAAAKESLGYVYTAAACGFSATLTHAQAEQLADQQGVLQVVKSQTVQLHSGHGIRQMHV